MTIDHLRELASGQRKRVSCVGLQVFQAPQYEGLTIADMLKFSEQYPMVAAALPSEPREILKLHRNYVSTVIYTLVGEPFAAWVKDRIHERNDMILQVQNMNAQFDPEIAAILEKSNSVSGRYPQLCQRLLKFSNSFVSL